MRSLRDRDPRLGEKRRKPSRRGGTRESRRSCWQVQKNKYHRRVSVRDGHITHRSSNVCVLVTLSP